MKNNILNNIKNILEPKSIAIIGASQKIGSIGYNILKNIVNNNFKGKIFGVNPKYNTECLGIPFFKSVLEIKNQIDLAIIVVPNHAVIDVINQCHQKSINSTIILSSGFKESGKDGEEIEKELTRLLKTYKINAVGPNTIGVINTDPKISLNATFTKNSPAQGKIALITQSGALGCGIINTMQDLPVGISKMVSIGNQSDLTVNDFIEYFGSDDEVEQIVLYLETIINPTQFRTVCQKVSKIKPIFAIKAGRSESGCKATISHTGSLAGNDGFADALFKQSGVIRQIDLQDVLTCCYAHSFFKQISGSNIAVMTNGMGPAILTADKFNDYGIELPNLSKNTISELKQVLSPLASFNNPIDMIASANLENYKNALEILAKDKNIDAIFMIYLELNDTMSSQIGQIVENVQQRYPNKTIISVYITNSTEFNKTLNQAKNVPVFKYTDDAVLAINSLIKYNSIKKLENQIISTQIKQQNPTIYNIIQNAKQQGRHLLTTHEALTIIKAFGIPTTPFCSSTDIDELISHAEKIGYPVVLKLSSLTLTHKTEVKGVILNIQSAQALKEEFISLKQRLKNLNELENVDSFIIQPMCKSNRELVVGMTRDNNYGPVIMFGQGGIFIEAQKDVAFKISPLSQNDINSIISSTNVSKLLGEVRKLPTVNYDKLKDTISKIDSLSQTYTQLRELDINPLLIDDKTGDVIAVDARIVID